MALNQPEHLTKVSFPSSQYNSSFSETYDYGGFDEATKRQDAIGALRDKKLDAMWDGDPREAMKAGNRIRDLLKAVRVHAPNATERDPIQLVTPLVRVASRSGSAGSNVTGGGYEGHSLMPGQRPKDPNEELADMRNGRA